MVVWNVWRGATTLLLLLLICVVVNALRDSAQRSDEKQQVSVLTNKFKPKTASRQTTTTTESSLTTKSSRRYGRPRSDNFDKELTINNSKNVKRDRNDNDREKNVKTSEKSTERRFSPSFSNRNKKLNTKNDPNKTYQSSEKPDPTLGPDEFRSRSGRKIQSTLSPRQLKSAISQSKQFSLKEKNNNETVLSSPRRLSKKFKNENIESNSETSTEAYKRPSVRSRTISRRVDTDESESVRVDTVESSITTYDVTEFPIESYGATDYTKFNFRKKSATENAKADEKKPSTVDQRHQEESRRKSSAGRSRSADRKITTESTETGNRRRSARSRNGSSRSSIPTTESIEQSTESSSQKRRTERRNRVTSKPEEIKSRKSSSRSLEVNQRRRSKVRSGNYEEPNLTTTSNEDLISATPSSEALVTLTTLTQSSQIPMTLKSGRKESDGSARNRDRSNGERRRPAKEDFFNHGLGFRGRRPKDSPSIELNTTTSPVTTSTTTTTRTLLQGNRGNPGWTLKRRPGFLNEGSPEMNDTTVSTTTIERSTKRGNARSREEINDDRAIKLKNGRRGNTNFAKGPNKNYDELEDDENYPANFKARLSQLKNAKGALPTPRTPVEDRKKISALFAARSRMKLENAQKLIKPELVIEDQDGTTTSDALTVIPDSEVKATRKIEKLSDDIHRYSDESVKRNESKLKFKNRNSTMLFKSRKQHEDTESTTEGKRTKDLKQRYRSHLRSNEEENDVQMSSTKSPQKLSRLLHRKHSTSDVAKFLSRNSSKKLFSTTETPKTKISVMRGKITESTSRITVVPKKLFEKLAEEPSSSDETPCDESTEKSSAFYDDLVTTATEVSSSSKTMKFESPSVRILEQKKESNSNVPIPIGTYITSHQLPVTSLKTDNDSSIKSFDENISSAPDFLNNTANEILHTNMNLSKPNYEKREFFYPIFTPSVQIEKRPRTATYRRHSELPENLFQPSVVQSIATTQKSLVPKSESQVLSQSLTENTANSVKVNDNVESTVGIPENRNSESGTSNIFNPARSALLASGNSTLIEQIRSTVAPLLNSLGNKSPVFSGAYKNINGNSVGRITPTAGSPRFTARYSGAEVFVRKPTFQATTPVITSSSKLFTPEENSLPVDISSPGEPKVLTFYHAVETAGIVNRQTNIVRAKVNRITDPNATNYPNDITIVAKVEPIPPISTSINFATNAPASVGIITTSTTTESTLVPTADQPETSMEIATTENISDPNVLEVTASNTTPVPNDLDVFNRIGKISNLSSNQTDGNKIGIDSALGTTTTKLVTNEEIDSSTIESSTVISENVSENGVDEVTNLIINSEDVTTANIAQTEMVTGSIVYVNDLLTLSTLSESETTTESTINYSTETSESLFSVNDTILSDVNNTFSSGDMTNEDSVTQQVVNAEVESTTSNLASQIIYEILTQYREPTVVNLLKEITDVSNETLLVDSSTTTNSETTTYSLRSLDDNVEATTSVPESSTEAIETTEVTSVNTVTPSFPERSILDSSINQTTQSSTINPLIATTTYAPDTDTETLINRLMQLAARIFPETLNIMQTLPSENDTQSPTFNDKDLQAITESNNSNSAQSMDDNLNENVTTTFLTTAPVEIPETTTQIPDTTTISNSYTDSNVVSMSTTNPNLDNTFSQATVSQTTDIPFTTIPFQVTTPATAQTTAGMETQTDQTTFLNPYTTTPIPLTTSPPESVDDNLVIVDFSTSTVPPIQTTEQMNITTTTTTVTPSSTLTNNFSTQNLGRFGGIRITPAPKFSSSSSTTAPLRDYLVYGIYPNNTIVRKRPEDNLIDARNVDSPYVIFGIYPDGKLVRKFPNGTVIPDPPENPVEVVFTLTTSTTTNRPRPMLFDNRVQGNQVIRNSNGVLDIRKPTVGLDIKDDLFGPNDNDVGLSSNIIGPSGSTSLDSMTVGSSASTVNTLQQMTSTESNAEIIPKVDFGSLPLVSGSNVQGGRVIQNRERDEATRTIEGEGQRGSVYTGQERIVNYWTNNDQKSTPQVLGVKINSVTTLNNKGTSINVPSFDAKSNTQSSNYPWKDPLDQIFGITTNSPTITASVSSNILDETNTSKTPNQIPSLNPYVDIFSPSLSTLDTTASSTTVSTTTAETTTTAKSTTNTVASTTTESTATKESITTVATKPITATFESTTTTTQIPTTTPVIITPETTTKNSPMTRSPTETPMMATLTPLQDLTDPLAHVSNVNAFGTSFDDLAFLNGLLFPPGDSKTTSTMKTLTEVEQMLANKIISLAIGQTPGTPGPTRSPKAVQSDSSNSLNVDSYIKKLAALTSTTQSTTTSTTIKPVTEFTWKPILQNSIRVKEITPLTTTTTTTTSTTTSKPTTTSTTTPKSTETTTRRTVLITAKPQITSSRIKITTPPPQGLGETLLRALFGGNLAPASKEIFNSNESSDFRRKPDVILKNSSKSVKTTAKPVQTTQKKVHTTAKPITSTTQKQEAQSLSANNVFSVLAEQELKLKNDVSNKKILPVRSTTYSPEDDAKFLEALFKAAQTQQLKPKGTNKSQLNKEDEAFLQKLLQGKIADASYQKEKPIEIVNGNDAALIAALLKAQGIEPTTPVNDLHQKLQLNVKTSTANPTTLSTPKKSVARKPKPTSARSLSSTYPPPLFSNFGLGSSPQVTKDNSVVPTDGTGRGNLRNQVMNAALGVTRAFSQFLNAAITGAAQQLQSFVNGTRYVSVTG